MSLITQIGNFFKRKPNKTSETSIPTEEKQKRMPTGNPNDILSVHEQNEKNRFQNKQIKRKRANKIAKTSRKYNYKQAA